MTLIEKIWELQRQVMILQAKENRTEEEEKEYRFKRDLYEEHKQWAR